jgi:hypothetical protein
MRICKIGSDKSFVNARQKKWNDFLPAELIFYKAQTTDRRHSQGIEYRF